MAQFVIEDYIPALNILKYVIYSYGWQGWTWIQLGQIGPIFPSFNTMTFSVWVKVLN